MRLRALLIVGALAVAGLVVGVVWSRVAPTADVRLQGGGVVLKDPGSKDFAGADGTLAVLVVLLGALASVAVYALSGAAFRLRVGTVLATVAGVVLASVLAWRVGVHLGPQPLETQALAAGGRSTDAVLQAPLRLRSRGVLLVGGLAATIVYLVLVAGSGGAQRSAAGRHRASDGGH